jgi:hypothetical protein
MTSSLGSSSAGWFLVIKLQRLLLFGRRHLVAVFGDILIAQRNASPAMALKRRL